MRIPDRETCFFLLQKYHFPQRKMKHVELVERVAIYLGNAIRDKGYDINLDLITAGALLHDVDKGIPGAGEVHPQKGVEILQKLGYPEVARVCARHSLYTFLDKKTRPATWEEKVVALSDKMVKDKVITVDERYKLWYDENLPEKAQEVLRKSYPLLKELEKEIFGIIGMRPEEVSGELKTKD